MYKARFLSGIIFLLAVAPSFSQQQQFASTGTSPQQSINTAPPPLVSEADNYVAGVRELLQQGKFEKIEEIAAKERATKARFAGGGWKLRTLYVALSGFPAGDKTPDTEWDARIETLQHWIENRRKSITPRLALAELYLDYAWKARGNGYADKVSDDGWKLFEERVVRAKTILDEAAGLKEKCPQWYDSMQTVALAQSWSKPQAARLFEDAIAFEPAYYYFYDQYANYLLPKWNGEEGETEQFADAITTRIGGKEGGVIYFKIAAEVGCNCGDRKVLGNMSWQKMQQGYAAIAELYGTSSLLLNQFAYMAIKMKDSEVAQKMFADIGENWDKEVWRTRKYFDVSRNWATYATNMSKEIKAATLLVEQNLQTTEGREYDGRISQEFAAKLNEAMQKCAQEGDGKDRGSFDLLLQVHDRGQVGTILPSHFATMNSCLYSEIRQTTFSPPPKSGYWVKIEMTIKP